MVKQVSSDEWGAKIFDWHRQNVSDALVFSDAMTMLGVHAITDVVEDYQGINDLSRIEGSLRESKTEDQISGAVQALRDNRWFDSTAIPESLRPLASKLDDEADFLAVAVLIGTFTGHMGVNQRRHELLSMGMNSQEIPDVLVHESLGHFTSLEGLAVMRTMEIIKPNQDN